MVTIPLISADTGLYKRLNAAIDSRLRDGYALHQLSTIKAAETFIASRFPELLCVNFSDTLPLLEPPHCALWLGHGGIIGLCRESHIIDRLHAMRGADILVALPFPEIEKQMPGIIDLIQDNRQLLSRDPRGNPGGTLSGVFGIRNSLFEADCAINLICNYLYRWGKLTQENKYFFHLPLYEMLINAIEHGNCGISYDEKSRYLERGGCAPDLIQKKCDDPAVASKKVSLNYKLTPSLASFVITDGGGGFNWREVIGAMMHKGPLRLHGRGILIARETVRTLRYNEKGNEVTLVMEYDSLPRLFRRSPPQGS